MTCEFGFAVTQRGGIYMYSSCELVPCPYVCLYPHERRQIAAPYPCVCVFSCVQTSARVFVCQADTHTHTHVSCRGMRVRHPDTRIAQELLDHIDVYFTESSSKRYVTYIYIHIHTHTKQTVIAWKERKK